MKTAFLSVLLFALLYKPALSQSQNSSFILTINLEDIGNVEKAELHYSKIENGKVKLVVDSLVPINQQVVFKGETNTFRESSIIIFYRKYINEKRPRRLLHKFFLIPDTIVISARIKDYSIVMSKEPDIYEYMKLKTAEKLYLTQKDHLIEKVLDYEEANDSNNILKTELEIEKVEHELLDKVYFEYAINNPTSTLSLFALEKSVSGKISNVLKYLDALNGIKETPYNTFYYQRLKERLLSLKNTAAGRLAPEFIQFDIAGNPIKLSDFKGKYVLIDFWASWCVPCRRGHPALKEFSNYTKDKNIQILSIALEKKEDRDKWLKAISEDELDWIQVTDFNYWKNTAAVLFGIESIPANVLIDPAGKIVARDISLADIKTILTSNEPK